jgi:hypothetical protein
MFTVATAKAQKRQTLLNDIYVLLQKRLSWPAWAGCIAAHFFPFVLRCLEAGKVRDPGKLFP